jgi:hypothetical protein
MNDAVTVVLTGTPIPAVRRAWETWAHGLEVVENTCTTRVGIDRILTGDAAAHVLVAAAETIPVARREDVVGLLAQADVVGMVGTTRPVRHDVRFAGSDAIIGCLLEHDGQTAWVTAWQSVRRRVKIT